MNKIVAQTHVLYIALTITFIMWFLCSTSAWVSEQVILHVALNAFFAWSGSAVCRGIAAFDRSQCSVFSMWGIYPSSWSGGSSLNLTAGPSPQPGCGSLTQHCMCYSSHVVRSCQKRPWQILLFCLWNDHVGLTLQTTIIIRSWLHCTCKVCFVGTCCHNLKAGGRFICEVNEKQHYSLVVRAVKKSCKNNRKDINIINCQIYHVAANSFPRLCDLKEL